MEEYISHEDYKKMLGNFGKQAPKKTLTEGLEQEGNAFTAGLAKTKKGGEFSVGKKRFKDRTNYDAPVNEYQFDQMYPDDPGPFEGNNLGDKDNRYNSLVSTNRGEDKEWAKLSRDEREKIMYADTDSDLANLDPNEVGGLGRHQNLSKGIDDKLKEFLARENDVNWDRMDDEEAEENQTNNGIEEDINLPSSQPTGPSIEETRRPLSHLSPEERDQLRQYVETIRTVKEQINKMVGKSGMEEGGDMTGLVMRPSTGNIKR